MISKWSRHIQCIDSERSEVTHNGEEIIICLSVMLWLRPGLHSPTHRTYRLHACMTRLPHYPNNWLCHSSNWVLHTSWTCIWWCQLVDHNVFIKVKNVKEIIERLCEGSWMLLFVYLFLIVYTEDFFYCICLSEIAEHKGQCVIKDSSEQCKTLGAVSKYLKGSSTAFPLWASWLCRCASDSEVV